MWGDGIVNDADVPKTSGAAALVLPVPTFGFALLVGAADVFLLGGGTMALGLDLGSPIVAGVNILLSIVIYIVFLCLFAGGDPRIWRYPARLRAVLASQETIDADGFDVMRAVVWRAGSSAMGRQMGTLAGLVAGASVGPRSEALSILAFLAVAGAVWLVVAMLVSAPDRAALAPWLDAAEDQPLPDQPDAGR